MSGLVSFDIAWKYYMNLVQQTSSNSLDLNYFRRNISISYTLYSKTIMLQPSYSIVVSTVNGSVVTSPYPCKWKYIRLYLNIYKVNVFNTYPTMVYPCMCGTKVRGKEIISNFYAISHSLFILLKFCL